MKQRIKIDSAILSFFIILTGFLYKFPNLYAQSVFFDDVMDFLGLLIILKGTFTRMVSRGYKKAHSKKGEDLVADGPYSFSRNPMYLGSFYMGIGFVMIVWPWWSLPLFAGLFYHRFRPQILKEEHHLEKLFGQRYSDYKENVPRIFPRFSSLRKVKINNIFPREYLWTTKEKHGLWAWPVAAVCLETFQEEVIFGFTDLSHTLYVFMMAVIVFAVSLWVLYHYA